MSINPYNKREREWDPFTDLPQRTEEEVEEGAEILMRACDLQKSRKIINPLIDPANFKGQNRAVSLLLKKRGIGVITPELCQSKLDLVEIDLSHNQIKIIPPEIGQLKHLNTLHLDHNQIKSIPKELGQLDSLETLSLKGNDIVTIPSEIWAKHRKGTLDFWVDLPKSYVYETLGNVSLTSGIPPDILQLIFAYLPIADLLRASLVSKKWCKLASSGQTLWKSLPVEKLLPHAAIYDAKFWEEFADIESLGLSFEGDGPAYLKNKREYIELLWMASKVEHQRGITILTLPKGLTEEILLGLIEEPMKGQTFNMTNITLEIDWDLFEGNQGLDKTYKFVITNEVLKNSVHLIQDKQDFLNEFNCQLPKTVAMMALVFLNFISDKEPNGDFKNLLDEYTICAETDSKGEQYVMFGGLKFISKHLTYLNEKDTMALQVGIAGARQLSILRSK